MSAFLAGREDAQHAQRGSKAAGANRQLESALANARHAVVAQQDCALVEYFVIWQSLRARTSSRAASQRHRNVSRVQAADSFAHVYQVLRGFHLQANLLGHAL